MVQSFTFSTFILKRPTRQLSLVELLHTLGFLDGMCANTHDKSLRKFRRHKSIIRNGNDNNILITYLLIFLLLTFTAVRSISGQLINVQRRVNYESSTNT